MENRTVAIYARQSLDKKDSLSIEGQIDLCKKECSEPKSIQIYCDKGFSGKNTKRPDFERMINDVRIGKIKKIIVYRLDRFSRSITDFSRIWSQLQENGVEFVSVNERFDTTTPMGKAMLYIIMVFAQLERETIAERVKDNYYQRAKKGNWPGGPAPYGFQNARVLNENGNKVPTLLPSDEIEVVKSIFQKYAEDGVSLGSIAKELTEQGIKCRKREFWDNVALSRILHSPIYVKADAAVYLYYSSKGVKFSNQIEDYDGSTSAHVVGKRTASERKYTKLTDQTVSLTNFAGIISSDVWLKCQHKLEQNSQIKNNGRGKYTWLSGYMKCTKCGYALSVKNSRAGKMYLGCSGHLSFHICDVKSFSVSVQELEDTVSAEIQNMIDKSKTNDFSIEERSLSDINKERLDEVDRKIQNLMDALANASDVTMKYINRELERLDCERDNILSSDETKRTEKKAYRDVEFDKLSFDEKKMVLDNYVDKVVVANDSVEIFWKV